MLFRYIKLKLGQINAWRWIVSIILLICILSINFKNYVDILDKITLFEYIIYALNDKMMILFYLLFVLVLIGGDIYNGSKNTFDDYIFLKIGDRKKWLNMNIAYIIMLCFLIIIILILEGSLVYLLNGKINIINDWSYKEELFAIGITPILALLWSIIFIWMRLILLSLIIFGINLKTMSYPLGFIGAFIITAIDWLFYEMFQIQEPLNILPIEHTRIMYTQAVAPVGGIRGSYISSLVYWGILIVLISLLVKYIIDKKDFMIQEIKI